MTKSLMTATFLSAVLVSCGTPKIYTPEEVKVICEQQRAEASGVQGNVSVGVNSKTGTEIGIGLSINDKFIRGLDPQAVFDQCMQKYADLNIKAAAAAAK